MLTVIISQRKFLDIVGSADDDGAPEKPPGIPYAAFLEKFRTQIEHSSTTLTHLEVFQIVRLPLSRLSRRRQTRADCCQCLLLTDPVPQVLMFG